MTFAINNCTGQNKHRNKRIGNVKYDQKSISIIKKALNNKLKLNQMNSELKMFTCSSLDKI